MPIAIDGTGTITGISAGGLPDATITTAEIVDANVTPGKLSQPLTLMTSQASTTGTFIDFTSIPNWARRITVMLSGVSTNGTSNIQLQIGTSGGLQTTGYLGGQGNAVASTTSGGATYTAGFPISNMAAASVIHGAITLLLVDSANGTWVSTSSIGFSNTAAGGGGGGSKTLSGTLDRLRITTVNGTDAFDAGTINVMYEG